jgi:hypothetical protein
LYPVYTGEGDALVPIGVLALGLVLLTFFHPGIRRSRGPDGSNGAGDLGDPGGSGGGAPDDDLWHHESPSPHRGPVTGAEGPRPPGDLPPPD